MIRTARVVFCDNEHGIGDVSFPETPRVEMEGNATAKSIWAEARKAGWKKIGGRHYCQSCVECMEEVESEGKGWS